MNNKLFQNDAAERQAIMAVLRQMANEVQAGNNMAKRAAPVIAKRTINSTATAKKIANDHGLVFVYVARGKRWHLQARHHVEGMLSFDFPACQVPDMEVDAFYLDCMTIAAKTATPAQMDIVVTRAKFAAMLDRLNMGEEFAPNSAESLEFVRLSIASTCSDKQVHAIEDAIYCMREEAEEVSGSYVEHKEACAPVCAVASYNKGRAIGYSVDGKFIASFPARLNGGVIPSPEEAARIVAGETIEAAQRMARETASAIAATLEPRCVPGLPLPAAFIVFTSYTRLTAVHPTVAAEFQLRRTSGTADFPGAIYPVRLTGVMSAWIGEPCATQEEAERAALAYLRSVPPIGARVSLDKPEEVANSILSDPNFALSVGPAIRAANAALAAGGSVADALAAYGANESNAVVMARAVAVVRDRRMTAEYVAATHGDDSEENND